MRLFCYAFEIVTLVLSMGSLGSGQTPHMLTAPWDRSQLGETRFTVSLDSEKVRFQFQVSDSEIVNRPFVDSQAPMGDHLKLVLADSPLSDVRYYVEIIPEGRARCFLRRVGSSLEVRNVPELLALVSRTANGYEVDCRVPVEDLRQAGLLKSQPERLLGAIFQVDVSSNNTMHWLSWQIPKSLEPDPFSPSALGDLLSQETVPPVPWTSLEKNVRLAEIDSRKQWSQFCESEPIKRKVRNWYENLDQFPESDEWLAWECQAGRLIRIKSSHTDQKSEAEEQESHLRPFLFGKGWTLRVGSEKRNLLPIHLINNKSGECLQLWMHDNWLLLAMSYRGHSLVWCGTKIDQRCEPSEIAIVCDGGLAGYGLQIILDGKPCPVEVFQPTLLDSAEWHVVPCKPEAQSREIEREWELQTEGQVSRLELYSQALTKCELLSWDSHARFRFWDDLSEDERRDWTEHFAQRYDRDGRYLMESIQHYISVAVQLALRPKGTN